MMIVSHRYRLIFMHTRKTAGSSIEVALSAVCGPEDIITNLHEDEPFRVEHGGRPQQNDLIPISRWTPRQWASLVKRRKIPRFYNHMPARHARWFLGRDVWDGYFKFAVERNPWDKAVSRYFWDLNGEHVHSIPPACSFSEFLATCPRWKLTTADVYSIRGNIAVDRVLRFDQLEEGLRHVAQELGIPRALMLPRMKASTRPAAVRDYRTMYTDADAERVAAVCSWEIETFGFDFDDADTTAP